MSLSQNSEFSRHSTGEPVEFCHAQILEVDHHENDDESSAALTIYTPWTIVSHAQSRSASKRASSPANPPPPASATAQPSQGGRNKRRKTAPARPDPCCPCSLNAVCSVRNCPCAMAGRPCLNCDPGNDKCRNSVEAVNERIDAHNRRNQRGSSSRRMRAFLGMESPPPLRHVAPQVDHDPPAAAMPGEDPILQLSFSDGEDNTASAQAGETDADRSDAIAGAAAMTSGGNTSRSLSTERSGVDSVGTAGEENEDAVPTVPPLAGAQCDIDAAASFGDGIHNDGEHGVAEGDERGGDDGDDTGTGGNQDGGVMEVGTGAPPPDAAWAGRWGGCTTPCHTFWAGGAHPAMVDTCGITAGRPVCPGTYARRP